MERGQPTQTQHVDFLQHQLDQGLPEALAIAFGRGTGMEAAQPGRKRTLAKEGSTVAH